MQPFSGSSSRQQWFMLIVMIILLTIAVSRTNYGLWDADIPFGDDAIYIDQTLRLAEQGEFSSSLYLNVYLLVFKFISADPITAHYCVRFLSSLLSVIALFLLLSSLSLVNKLGAFVMALFWSLNLLNSPLVQYVSINLFVFALVCFAGYLWLSGPRHWRFLAIAVLLTAVVMRYEYSLLLLFLALQQLWLWASGQQRDPSRRPPLVRAGATVFVLLVVFLGVLAFNPELRQRTFRNFPDLNAYFFLGFTQHYSIFTVTRDASVRLDPYTEYDLLINQRFPGATDFLSAVQANPGEVAGYLARNFMANLTRIHYVLPSHSVLLPSGLVTNGLTGRFGTGEFVAKKFPGYPLLWLEQAASVLFVAAGALWLLIRSLRRHRIREFFSHDDAVYVVGMAAVASVSFVMHIPDPRYWIMLIPLLYWGVAALISKGSHVNRDGIILVACALVSLAIVNPLFTSSMNGTAHRNKDVALALREKLAAEPVQTGLRVLGYYPRPLMIFAGVGRSECTDNLEVSRHASYEALVHSNAYDLLIIDAPLKSTAQYRKEQRFFETFQASPEAYGYELILEGHSREADGHVATYRRKPAGRIAS